MCGTASTGWAMRPVRAKVRLSTFRARGGGLFKAGTDEEASFAFPRPQPRAMSNVMNNDLVQFDFVYDQVVADRKSPEFGMPRRRAQIRLLGDLSCCLFDTRDELGRCPAVVFRNVRENFFKIGERTAFVPKFHALR